MGFKIVMNTLQNYNLHYHLMNSQNLKSFLKFKTSRTSAPLLSSRNTNWTGLKSLISKCLPRRCQAETSLSRTMITLTSKSASAAPVTTKLGFWVLLIKNWWEKNLYRQTWSIGSQNKSADNSVSSVGIRSLIWSKR